jgi:hypothetical protein
VYGRGGGVYVWAVRSSSSGWLCTCEAMYCSSSKWKGVCDHCSQYWFSAAVGSSTAYVDLAIKHDW